MKYLLIGCVLLTLAGVWFWLNTSKSFPITEILISGDFTHVQPATVQANSMEVLNTGFFNVDMARLHSRLVQIPWVRRVDIKRVWPNKLEVHIHEQHAVAILNDAQLMNPKGELFNVPRESFPRDLPHLYADVSQSQDILKLYKQISLLADPQGLQVRWLRFNKRDHASLQLTNGITIVLGQHEPIAKFTKMLQIYSQLKADAPIDGELETIDLRYLNGLAVSHRKTTPAMNMLSLLQQN